MPELSERAQERQFTCKWLGEELQKLAESYIDFRDAHVEKGDYSSAARCDSKSEAFDEAARNVRSFGHVVA